MSKTEITLETAPSSQYSLRRLTSEIDRFVPWIVAVVLLEITVLGTLKAFYKPFWLDEIMGVLIAKLPVSSDIWAICKSGADNQPPLYHYAMRASVRIFGNDGLGMRIPSLTGYILFCLCLYWFVSRRTSRLYGLVAMLVPEFTRCWAYATEGRPYGLILGCAGLGAVCWQSVVMQRRRALMLAGLSLSLVCALNLHYYGVLLFLPLWIAESVRTYRRGKVDFPLWLALTTPLLVLLIYLPVIRASKVNSGVTNAFFAKPSLHDTFWKFAGEVLEPSLVALICLGTLYFAVQIFGRSSMAKFARDAVARRAELIPEASLVLGFICLPIFAIFLSRFGTHIFYSRYALAGGFGYAALIGFSAWLAFGDRKGPAMALASVFIILILRDQLRGDFGLVMDQRKTPARVGVFQRLPKQVQEDTLPIVAISLDDFMQFIYYGDPAFRKRLFYVSSEALAEHYLGFTFHERMMIGSAPYFGTQVVDYATFIREHQSFYVFGFFTYPEWVVPQLIADHVDLRVLQGGPSNIYGGFADDCLKANITGR